MGCNIHLHTEIKVEGKWHHWGAPNMPRWYDLYAKMAGVRCSEFITPLSMPRGIPEDTTDTTKLFIDYDNYHDHSWLGADEIAELEQWSYDYRPDSTVEPSMRKDNFAFPESMWGYLLGNPWSSYQEADIEDIRFIFWFDN